MIRSILLKIDQTHSYCRELLRQSQRDSASAIQNGIMAPLPILPEPNEDGLYSASDLYQYGVLCLKHQQTYDIAAVQGVDPPQLS